MKFNPLDGDRVKDAYLKQKTNKECESLLKIFKKAKRDRLDGKEYKNNFKDTLKRLAYKNGYNSWNMKIH